MSYQLVPQFKGEDLNLCLSPKPRVGAVKAKFQFRSLGPARPRGHSATMKAFDNIPLEKKGGYAIKTLRAFHVRSATVASLD